MSEELPTSGQVFKVQGDAETVNDRMEELLADDDTYTLSFLWDPIAGEWLCCAMWENNEGCNFQVDPKTARMLSGMHEALRHASQDAPSEEVMCPSCGARPFDTGDHIETLHASDCKWMANPQAEPYDDRLTLVSLDEPPEDVVPHE